MLFTFVGFVVAFHAYNYIPLKFIFFWILNYCWTDTDTVRSLNNKFILSTSYVYASISILIECLIVLSQQNISMGRFIQKNKNQRKKWEKYTQRETNHNNINQKKEKKNMMHSLIISVSNGWNVWMMPLHETQFAFYPTKWTTGHLPKNSFSTTTYDEIYRRKWTLKTLLPTCIL